MTIFTIILPIFCCIFFYHEYCVATEIQFDRIEILNNTFVEGFYNVSEFRITKFNRTTYVLNTKAELFLDLTTDIKVQVNYYFNRLNNNQYYKTPMALPKDAACNFAEKFYRKFVMTQVKDISNLPQLKPGDPVCPLPKVITIDLY